MNKKNILTLSILTATLLLLSACSLPFINVVRGSGRLMTETRQVSSFSKIRLDGAGRLMIRQGESESLEIRAEDNIIDELVSEVEDDTLILGYKEQTWRKTLIPTRAITYTLTVTDLTEITFNGAGDFEIERLETASLDVALNGAGQITIGELVAENLSVKISGTGNINISGVVQDQVINIEGAGNYQAGDLKTQSTVVEIAGLGNGTVWAADTLDVTITGGGSVDYYGTPDVTQAISGFGDVVNLGEK